MSEQPQRKMIGLPGQRVETKPAEAAIAPQPAKAAPPPELWHPMDEAPKDGTYILIDDGSESPKECFWYRTREFSAGYWVATGWWKFRFGGNTPIDFAPQGFRRMTEVMAA